MLRSIAGYIRTALSSKQVSREFTRLGITDEVLESRAVEINEATPEFLGTRGRPWAEMGAISQAYLDLLRRLPDNCGPDALIAEFRAVKRRGYV